MSRKEKPRLPHKSINGIVFFVDKKKTHFKDKELPLIVSVAVKRATAKRSPYWEIIHFEKTTDRIKLFSDNLIQKHFWYCYSLYYFLNHATAFSKKYLIILHQYFWKTFLDIKRIAPRKSWRKYCTIDIGTIKSSVIIDENSLSANKEDGKTIPLQENIYFKNIAYEFLLESIENNNGVFDDTLLNNCVDINESEIKTHCDKFLINHPTDKKFFEVKTKSKTKLSNTPNQDEIKDPSSNKSYKLNIIEQHVADGKVLVERLKAHTNRGRHGMNKSERLRYSEIDGWFHTSGKLIKNYAGEESDYYINWYKLLSTIADRMEWEMTNHPDESDDADFFMIIDDFNVVIGFLRQIATFIVCDKIVVANSESSKKQF